MKKILFIVAGLALMSWQMEKYALPCSEVLLERSYDTLLAQVGTLEKNGKNDGEVEKYLHSLGLRKGQAYCAAGQYYCFYNAAKEMKFSLSEIPIPRTGHANSIFNYAKKYGKRKSYQAQQHDLIVWRKKKSSSGHIERIIEVNKAGWVRTVGFNTSSGKRGSQRDGEGVFIRKRNIYHPLAKMLIRGLIGFYEVEK